MLVLTPGALIPVHRIAAQLFSLRSIWSVFLLLSGVASLTYQVTWVRLLGLSMGSTSASISTVVGAFFLGLALGSYFAERILRRRVHSLTPYLVLEMMIGICGFVLLPILLHLDSVVALIPVLGASLLAKFTVAMVLFSVPTICMGATFPVVAALAIRDGRQLGSDLGHLYSLNTAGAVFGACLSGFVFIPSWGLDGAIYIACALNMAIVGIGLLSRRAVNRALEASSNTTEVADAGVDLARPNLSRNLAIIALFCTGLVSIATEVGWTKYLSIYTGTTIYGFAAILTVFLIGIAAGSWWVRPRLASLRNPNAALAIGLALVGGMLLLTRAGLTVVPSLFQAVNHIDVSATAYHAIKYASVFVLLILPTVLLGALFPLNLMLYCGGLQGVRQRVGRAYAVNTIAGIVGSVGAGFWVIPMFGTDALLVACAFVVLALSVLYIPVVTTAQHRAAIATAVGLVVVGYWQSPSLDYSRLIASVGYTYDADVRAGRKPKIIFLEEGKAGVISVVSYDDSVAKLQNNGLNESLLYLDDPTRGLVAEQLLALVPYFIHNAPKKAFVVGFGGGITTRALTYTDLESIHVVELEPSVIHAGRAVAQGEIPTLLDPRVRLDYNDARNTLLLEDERYDIIVSQPSHPWLAGAANVFTTQFFTIAKSRLNPGGVYGQWVNLFNMDATTLKSILSSFYSVFPEGVTFGSLRTGDYLLFGSDQPIKLDYDRINARMDKPAIRKALAHYDVANAEELMWYYALSRREAVAISGDALLNTDTNLLTEVRLSRLTEVPEGAENPYSYILNGFRFDLDPYMPENELVQRYYSAGLYFLRWDTPKVARLAAKQIAARDERLGRSLEYEVLLYEERDAEATKLYEAHETWADRVHSKQSERWALDGKFDLARRAADRIEDKAQNETAQARLLFYRKDFQRLAGLKAGGVEARKWQLLGSAQTDLVRSGAELDKMKLAAKHDLPLLRTMVGYYSAIQNVEQTDRFARLISAELDARVQKLRNLVSDAIDDGALDYAGTLVDKIATINPGADDLKTLRARIQKRRDSSVATTSRGAG